MPRKPSTRKRRAESPSAHSPRRRERIIARSHDLRETLDRITDAVAERMDAEVCSLYILDQKEQQLTLWATTGLEHSSVGKVRMSVGRGTHRVRDPDNGSGRGSRCPGPSPVQVLPRDGRGTVPLLFRGSRGAARCFR